MVANLIKEAGIPDWGGRLVLQLQKLLNGFSSQIAILIGSGIITPDQFKLPGDPDYTNAITAAEASLTAGQVLWFLGGKTYTVSAGFASLRQGFSWQGWGFGQSILLYAGASTTIDLLHVGNTLQDTIGVNIKGFSIQSSTKMTAGTALHLENLGRGQVDVQIQGQDAFQTLGNNLFRGIWFDKVDNVEYTVRGAYAQSDVGRVNGTVGAGAKADLVLHNGGGRIGGGTCGFRCGGGFGGLIIEDVDFSANVTNFIADQTLAAEGNREIFLNDTVSDVTTTGAGIILDDVGGASFHMTGGWAASAATHGIWIKNWSTSFGVVMIKGVDVVNNGVISTGDGIRIDTTCVVNIDITARLNSGYGINPNVASNNVSWSGVLYNNTLGQVNLAHPGNTALLGYWSQWQQLNALNLLWVGDGNFAFAIAGGNPEIVGNPNLFQVFDRTNGLHEWNSPSHGSGSVLGLYTGPGWYASGNGMTLAQLNTAANSAATAGDGARAWITDATTAYGSATIGSTAVGTGTHGRPVMSVSGVWVYSG